MAQHLTEEEQVEALKNFVKEYGVSIVVGLLLAFLIGMGWQKWKQHQVSVKQKASMLYDKMLNSALQHEQDKVSTYAEQLQQHYSNTPYAAQAALLLAKQSLPHQPDAAILALQWAIAHTRENALKQIANTRIARIQLSQHNPKATLETLKTGYDNHQQGWADEIRGDAYLQLGNSQKAHAAYQDALKHLPKTAVNRPILEMKRDDTST